MSNRLIMKISETIITEFEIDLDDWYSWEDRTSKERHEQIQQCLDFPQELMVDGGIKVINKDGDLNVLDWDLEED